MVAGGEEEPPQRLPAGQPVPGHQLARPAHRARPVGDHQPVGEHQENGALRGGNHHRPLPAGVHRRAGQGEQRGAQQRRDAYRPAGRPARFGRRLDLVAAPQLAQLDHGAHGSRQSPNPPSARRQTSVPAPTRQSPEQAGQRADDPGPGGDQVELGHHQPAVPAPPDADQRIVPVGPVRQLPAAQVGHQLTGGRLDHRVPGGAGRVGRGHQEPAGRLPQHPLPALVAPPDRAGRRGDRPHPADLPVGAEQGAAGAQVADQREPGRPAPVQAIQAVAGDGGAVVPDHQQQVVDHPGPLPAGQFAGTEVAGDESGAGDGVAHLDRTGGRRQHDPVDPGRAEAQVGAARRDRHRPQCPPGRHIDPADRARPLRVEGLDEHGVPRLGRDAGLLPARPAGAGVHGERPVRAVGAAHRTGEQHRPGPVQQRRRCRRRPPEASYATADWGSVGRDPVGDQLPPLVPVQVGRFDQVEAVVDEKGLRARAAGTPAAGRPAAGTPPASVSRATASTARIRYGRMAGRAARATGPAPGRRGARPDR